MSLVIRSTPMVIPVQYLPALKTAAEKLGLVFEDGEQNAKRLGVLPRAASGTYKTWDGRKVVVRSDAHFVIRCSDEQAAKIRAASRMDPLETGVLWDRDQHSYRVGGFSGDSDYAYVRDAVERSRRLTQMYNVERDRMVAEANGDTQVVLPQSDGSILVGSAGDFITLADGTRIPLGIGDIVSEIHTPSVLAGSVR